MYKKNRTGGWSDGRFFLYIQRANLGRTIAQSAKRRLRFGVFSEIVFALGKGCVDIKGRVPGSQHK
jgi:hypothetical protein